VTDTLKKPETPTFDAKKTRRFRFNWVDGFLWFIRVFAIITIVIGVPPDSSTG
jgi:hypothetical protein